MIDGCVRTAMTVLKLVERESKTKWEAEG